MELKQVKSILHQSECGEMFLDGMGCSEPILTKSKNGLIDNFFVYLANKKEETYSATIAKISLLAENGSIIRVVSCSDEPFSVPPTETIKVDSFSPSEQDYKEYSALYAKIRSIAFKTPCSSSEQQTISAYLDSLEKVVNKSLFPFYKELAPTFFEWATNELK